jgi:predicted anti-sigma-YlaC factor YlaD
MNCRKVSRRLSAYIEGDLSPQEITLFEGHLKTCASCRRKIADIRLIVETSHQLETQEPGPYFVNRLLCAIGRKSNPREILSGWRYRLTLSGVAFVTAASVTFYVIGPPATIVSVPGTNENIQAGLMQNNDSLQSEHGFPVSDEALERDLALTEKPKSDSLADEPEGISRSYVQPVSVKKTNSDDQVF